MSAQTFWAGVAGPWGPLDWAQRFASLPEVPTAGPVWVISDLHLPPRGGEVTERFVAWCAATAPRHLVCLGDLFDVWVGRSQAKLAGTEPVRAALAGIVGAGGRVDLITGNRDVLLGEDFARSAGAVLHPDGLVLTGLGSRPELGGAEAGAGRVLCLHGDELCVREPGYLRLRAVLRSPALRGLARIAPLWFARAVGRGLRRRYSGTRGPRLTTRGPQPDAALAAGWAARASLVLSGHSHAPEDVLLPGGRLVAVEPTRPTVRWITLGAFGDGADVARLAIGAGAGALSGGIALESAVL